MDAEKKGDVPSIPFPTNSGDSRGPADYEDEVGVCWTLRLSPQTFWSSTHRVVLNTNPQINALYS